MKTTSLLQLVKGAFIALIAITLGSTAAQAQASRTWVSGVGDDVNPCSRTAPCKTFPGAISKTAAGGEISVLDPGGFGAVTINKNMTISGDGTLAGILNAGGNGVLISGAGISVTLRNLSIKGITPGSPAGTPGLNGIRILNASEVNIENCTIEGQSGFGILIEPTAVCGVTIKHTTIRDCTAGAVVARPAAATGAAVNISNSSLNDSPAFGFRAEENVKAVLDNCVIAGNGANGVVVQPVSTASKVTLSRCTINDNGGFGALVNGSLGTIFISNNVIFNNGVGVGALSSGVMTSLGNNNIRGNATEGTPLPPVVGNN
jgi:parallel beta-helix repeat protein